MKPVRSENRRSRPTGAIKTRRRPTTARGVLNGAARRSEDAEPQPRFTGRRRRFPERMGFVDYQVHELSGQVDRLLSLLYPLSVTLDLMALVVFLRAVNVGAYRT